jgi:hypothetical protein
MLEQIWIWINESASETLGVKVKKKRFFFISNLCNFQPKCGRPFFGELISKKLFVFHLPLEEEECGVEVSPTEVKMETALALLNNQACTGNVFLKQIRM